MEKYPSLFENFLEEEENAIRENMGAWWLIKISRKEKHINIHAGKENGNMEHRNISE